MANTTAALGLLTKPLIDKPGKATTLSTPGCSSVMRVISRVTASVRSSDAPGGSCTMPTRKYLSCAGTKPVGVARKPITVSATSARVDQQQPRAAPHALAGERRIAIGQRDRSRG